MRKSKFSDEQIIRALRRLEDGTAAGELCRKLGVSQATLYRWKRKYAGLGVSELRELKQLRDENRRLKQVVADLTLDKDILQEAVKRKW
jgi:putative transposase